MELTPATHHAGVFNPCHSRHVCDIYDVILDLLQHVILCDYQPAILEGEKPLMIVGVVEYIHLKTNGVELQFVSLHMNIPLDSHYFQETFFCCFQVLQTTTAPLFSFQNSE